jgi:hypothetical protein
LGEGFANREGKQKPKTEEEKKGKRAWEKER